MRIRHPPSVAHVQILVAAPWKRYFIGAVIVGLYAFSLQWGVQTSGEPYRWALEEQKRTIKEKAKELQEKGLAFESGKQDRKDADLSIDEESLPSQLLPDAWACAAIFLTISVHLLFHLMCHWSISFKAAALYQPANAFKAGSFVRVTPNKNKGKAAICLVEESEVTLRFHFRFQYQMYEVLEPDEQDPELVGDEGAPAVRLIRCPTNLKWVEYRNAKGLVTDTEVEKAQDRYGTNNFELPRPTFLDLFKKQLMAPLAIFQFFCTALWMLDTYWKYTCFTLLSVLGFEASTAFQRLKSMAQLRGMGTKSYNVNVFRMSQWTERSIEELLPGDIVSLVAKRPEPKGEGSEKVEDKQHLMIPCDCLLLRGSAIVNEATLTGESVPQMKDELPNVSDETATVDAFGKHRVHALFSGTSLIQVTPPPKALPQDSKKPSALCPPDDGIVCYVLRTGFNSSQGELMRMIEFSTEEVAADKLETAAQLLFLLIFALAAAGYVLKKGLEDPTRPTYKTLLRCTLIITSVVPPQLPMQMAFAVHTALMSLLKSGIHCTEPFRVPYAGRVAYCFFDKTGTLTSDQMVAVGIVNADGKGAKEQDGVMQALATKKASMPAAMVVAGCHSLIEVEGKAIGDPIEVAALNGVAWSYVPSTATASPTAWKNKERFMAQQKELMGHLKDDVEADRKEKEEIKKKLEDFEKQLKMDRLEAKRLQVTIEGRFHFSSELQRMSTICKVVSQLQEVKSGSYCLTKGSPEAVQKLCRTTPSWYDTTYRSMAEKGQRVLALAYKQLDSDPQAAKAYGQKPRDEAETDMTFAGFISFRCENRKDSMLVVKALQDSKHSCVMLTGDAPLTALSVAQEVGICDFPSEKALILQEKEHTGELEWLPAITTKAASSTAVPFEAAAMQQLRERHDLVVTGHALELALRRTGSSMEEHLHAVQIYARLSPAQKEQIISAVRRHQKVHALMCGDGGNDVGALKEADVGLALLSGFGNANAGGSGEELAKREEVKDAEDALAEQRKENALRAQAAAKKAQEEFARKRKDLMSKQQQWIEEELQAMRDRGEEVGVMSQFTAMKKAVSKMQAELKKEQEIMQKKHGNSFAAGAAKWAGDMEGMDDTPMVQLGDASTAAPFTTRTPSIGACVDIIRQGRCTLLSAVQQMEIMMLESMISAYTMSTMSVDGTRPSEAQMMASGTLISVASLAFSFARPVDKMHPVRPLSSVFHPAIFFSMLGQLAIHLCCMVYIAEVAKGIMGPEKLQEVIQFEAERNKKIESMDEDAFSEWNWFLSVPFKNNLLNTCCWLVETSQQIAVIFVNYKGRPWMKGMLENQPLFLSLFACVVLVGICAWGAFPWLNSILNLEDVPPDLRIQVMICLLVSLVGSFLWDRLMVCIFAKQIWQTMIEEAKSTSIADFLPILKTVGYIAGGLLMLGIGNPLLWGLCFWMYKSRQNAAAANPQEQARAGRHQ